MIDSDYYISAATTLPIPGQTYHEFMDKMKKEIEITFDFGMKIKDRNIFYFLLMKDKLSNLWGFSLMIGERVILDWTNSTDERDDSP